MYLSAAASGAIRPIVGVNSDLLPNARLFWGEFHCGVIRGDPGLNFDIMSVSTIGGVHVDRTHEFLRGEQVQMSRSAIRDARPQERNGVQCDWDARLASDLAGRRKHSLKTGERRPTVLRLRPDISERSRPDSALHFGAEATKTNCGRIDAVNGCTSGNSQKTARIGSAARYWVRDAEPAV